MPRVLCSSVHDRNVRFTGIRNRERPRSEVNRDFRAKSPVRCACLAATSIDERARNGPPCLSFTNFRHSRRDIVIRLARRTEKSETRDWMPRSLFVHRLLKIHNCLACRGNPLSTLFPDTVTLAFGLMVYK